MTTIGFVGTGTISAAMVRGLASADPGLRIVVSPRSESVSMALAQSLPNVTRAASNQEVVGQSDIVVLGMRPAQLTDALAGIGFRREQVVVSLVAGLSMAEIQNFAGSARAVRVVPLPGIEHRVGPITLYPRDPQIEALLAPLGDLVVAQSEDALHMGGLSAFMSSYFEMQARLIDAAVAAGAPAADARTYVISLLSMLADTANRTPHDQLARLVPEHQTKGGLNEFVRGQLMQSGWYDTLAKALHDVGTLSWNKLG